jgi:uncharacterized protein with HEPN domain
MQRDSRAYLNDILDAAAAIQEAIIGVTAETYGNTRLIRSSVEREFIIIGEALRAISLQAPDLFKRIPEARQIIDFRNLLTHEYPNISAPIVWGCIQADLPLLTDHCLHELNQLNQNPS